MTIDQIRNLPPATVNIIVSSAGKNSAGLSEEQVQYLLQINAAASILNSPDHDGSQLEAARQLQRQYPQISLRTARRRVADAVSYLYSDQQNTPEQWHEFYADKMDRLARQAEQAGDMKTAMACYSKAHELRAKAADGRVDPSLTEFRQILVSPDLGRERLGLEHGGMRELLEHAYELIEQSNLPEKEKQRLREEAAMEVGE